jgi:hypothetical protein
MFKGKGTFAVMQCSLGCFGKGWGFQLWGFWCLGYLGLGFRCGSLGVLDVWVFRVFSLIFRLFLVWFPLYTSYMLRNALRLFNNISLLIYQNKICLKHNNLQFI